METLVERLAYAIARGITQAYLDVLREREKSYEETVTDADASRRHAFAVAAKRMQAAEESRDPGSINSPSGGAGSNGGDPGPNR